MQRPARVALEDDDRLALICDADAREIAPMCRRTGEHLIGHGKCVEPDLFGVVLDPSGSRIHLAMLTARVAEYLTLQIEQQRFGRGRTLIDREQALHGSSPRGGAPE